MTYKYTAVIVEPRKHKAIEFVLNNVCDCLSNEWKVVFFHGSTNYDYVNEIIERLNILFDNRISMVNLHIENLNQVEYSRLFATKSVIYDHINTDMFLVFQTDSMIYKKNAHLIYDFLHYDYVGPPWIICEYLYTKMSGFIGNGGFSLRNKNKMIEIIEKIDWNNRTILHEQLEDLYFSRKYDNIELNKPEYLEACKFCIDEVYSEHPFSCHRPWQYNYYYSVFINYRETGILKSLQGVVTEQVEVNED